MKQRDKNTNGNRRKILKEKNVYEKIIDRSEVQNLKIREYLKKLLSWNFLVTPLLKKYNFVTNKIVFSQLIPYYIQMYLERIWSVWITDYRLS